MPVLEIQRRLRGRFATTATTTIERDAETRSRELAECHGLHATLAIAIESMHWRFEVGVARQQRRPINGAIRVHPVLRAAPLIKQARNEHRLLAVVYPKRSIRVRRASSSLRLTSSIVRCVA